VLGVVGYLGYRYIFSSNAIGSVVCFLWVGYVVGDDDDAARDARIQGLLDTCRWI
jgi:hypothetical protein